MLKVKMSTSNSPEMRISGLVMNLLYFLCTNRLSRHEKKQILTKFIKKLPLKQYSGCFTSNSWDAIQNWVDNVLLDSEGALAHIYVCQTVSKHMCMLFYFRDQTPKTLQTFIEAVCHKFETMSLFPMVLVHHIIHEKTSSIEKNNICSQPSI